MRVQFNVFPTDSKSAWGYPIEVTEQGVFGDVPEDMIDLEVEAGRIKAPAKVSKPVENVTDEPKRMGRPPKVD